MDIAAPYDPKPADTTAGMCSNSRNHPHQFKSRCAARGSGEANAMWGMIAKIKVVPGKRDEIIAILRKSAGADMRGCLSYVVAKDTADENTIWVTEVWDSRASHDASLSSPAVKSAMRAVSPIVSNFEKVAVTEPQWGIGLSAACTQ